MSAYNYSRFQEEDDEREINGTITITFSFRTSFPVNWDRSEIEEYIRDNPNEFMDKVEEMEIDING